MPSDASRFDSLAAILGISTEQLARHVVLPLAAPVHVPCPRWNVPDTYLQVLAIADGINLFGIESWEGFRLWGSFDYADCVNNGGPIFNQANQNNLLPIYGAIPHLVSLSGVDGTVVVTDWEVYQWPEHGWGRVIAANLAEYVRTVIEVRECYPDDGDMPSDWWSPYASHGSRYDLQSH